MAASRLNDTQKQELVARYRSGEPSSALADAFGCSVNTVSRTVRNLLPADEYDALKSARARGLVVAESDPPISHQAVVAKASSESEARQVEGAVVTPEDKFEEEGDGGTLALDDADDFGGNDNENQVSEGDTSVEIDGSEGEDPFANQFHEVAILTGVSHGDSHEPLVCQPMGPGVLPESVYMLVDKVVELDPRPLSDFPELGTLDSSDRDRQALCLYASPRSAKRQCGRQQRVIRVPDTSVFTLTTRYLLARGITRLVLEGVLIALDA